MNGKTMLAAWAALCLPAAATAQLEPMSEPAMRAVQAQGPLLDAGLRVIEELIDLEELEDFDPVQDIIAALDELIDPGELDDVLDLTLFPSLIEASVDEARTKKADRLAWRAQFNDGVAGLLPARTLVGQVAGNRLTARADRLRLQESLWRP